MLAVYFVEHIFSDQLFEDHHQWLLPKKWPFLGFSNKKYLSWNYINKQIKVCIFPKSEEKNVSLFQWETFLIGI